MLKHNKAIDSILAKLVIKNLIENGIPYLHLVLATLLICIFAGINLINLLKFSLLVLFIAYIPGSLMLRCLKVNVSDSRSWAFASVVGIVLSTMLYSSLGFLGYRILFTPILSMLNLILIIYRYSSFFSKENYRKLLDHKLNPVFFLLVILAIISLAWIQFPNGKLIGNDLKFFETHAFDGIFHLALINELAREIPPQFPFFAGHQVSYHFFSDLLATIFLSLGHFSTLDIFFRFLPLLIFLLTLFTVFGSVKFITGRNSVATLSVALIFFMGDFSFIPAIFNYAKGLAPINGRWDVLFWNPIVANLYLNPSHLYSLPLFFSGIYFLTRYLRLMEKGSLIIAGLLFGSLVSFKMFAAVPTFLGIFLAASVEIIQRKDFKLFKLLAIATFVALIAYLPNLMISSPKLLKFSLGYYAFTILPRLGYLSQAQIDSIISESLGVKVGLGFVSLIVLMVGSFGIRLLALPQIHLWIKNPKEDDKLRSLKTTMVFVLVSSFILPFLIIGSGQPHVTLSIYVFFIAIAAIPTSIFIVNKLKHKARTAWHIIFATTFFIMLASATQYLVFGSKGYYISVTTHEFNALSFLANHTHKNSIVLHNKFNLELEDGLTSSRRTLNDRNFIVAGLGGRRVVTSGSTYLVNAGILEEDVAKRRADIDIFFSTSSWRIARNIVKRYRVDYVYVDNQDRLYFDTDKLLTRVFDNQQVAIYKVKQF